MDNAMVQDMQSSPTILRIKRKRTDEPLDALVIESKSRRKKSRGASGFFQFAETVEEETFWQDSSLTKDLKTRITTLASDETLAEKTDREGKSSPGAPPGRRYTIVKKGLDTKSSASPVVQQANKPEVVEGEDFTMYDAVLESHSSIGRTADVLDAEMEKFLPMLQEYLRSASIVNDVPSNITQRPATDTDEYVWDVFFHRTDMADWTTSANVATVTGLPPIGPYNSDSDSDSGVDEDDEDSNTEDFYRNDYPDDDPDQDSEDNDSEEEYPEISDEDGEDERELNQFLAWHRRR